MRECNVSVGRRECVSSWITFRGVVVVDLFLTGVFLRGVTVAKALCVCVCVCAYACACVCVCARALVCVRVCDGEKDRERLRKRGKVFALGDMHNVTCTMIL